MPKQEYEELEQLLSEGKAAELLNQSKDLIFKDVSDGWGYYYGAMAEALGQAYDQANNMIHIALDKDPNNAKFHAAKAEILMKIEKYTLAEQEYKQAIGLDIQNAVAWFFYGKYLIEQKKKHKAGLRCMYHAAGLEPDHIGMLTELGKYYLKYNLNREAKKIFRQILVQDPENKEVNYCYGSLLIAEGMPGAALEYIKRAYVGNWRQTHIEKAFFKAYKAIHPRKGMFWQATLWLNHRFIKVALLIAFIGTYFLERGLSVQFFLLGLVWAYSLLGPLSFYKMFEKEYELLSES